MSKKRKTDIFSTIDIQYTEIVGKCFILYAGRTIFFNNIATLVVLDRFTFKVDYYIY